MEVVDLTQGSTDLHRFQPSPSVLGKAREAQLYLASGKGLESYLGKLQGIVGKDRLVEVGSKIPSLTYGKGSSLHSCCPHDTGPHDTVKTTVDPHWWQSLDAWRRAATIVADEFAKRDPVNRKTYKANAKRLRSEFDGLKSWAKGQLGRVPKKQRVLASSHAAFGYFCEEFGWDMLPIQGLNREAASSPQHLTHVAEALREHGIPAVFPETNSNPKALQTLVKQTGVKVGKPLNPDGSGTTIKGMFQHNVTAIVQAMAAGE